MYLRIVVVQSEQRAKSGAVRNLTEAPGFRAKCARNKITFYLNRCEAFQFHLKRQQLISRITPNIIAYRTTKPRTYCILNKLKSLDDGQIKAATLKVKGQSTSFYLFALAKRKQYIVPHTVCRRFYLKSENSIDFCLNVLISS